MCTINRYEIETKRFGDKVLIVLVGNLVADWWSRRRQVIAIIWFAGWIATNTGDWERMRRHCRCFCRMLCSRDSRRILSGFQNSLG
jgi:hypothetical protein